MVARCLNRQFHCGDGDSKPGLDGSRSLPPSLQEGGTPRFRETYTGLSLSLPPHSRFANWWRTRGPDIGPARSPQSRDSIHPIFFAVSRVTAVVDNEALVVAPSHVPIEIAPVAVAAFGGVGGRLQSSVSGDGERTLNGLSMPWHTLPTVPVLVFSAGVAAAPSVVTGPALKARGPSISSVTPCAA